MERSDIIIVGAGPGGYETAAEAAHLGKRVTLIERDLLGGTCLNRGCIPTKALCASAAALDICRDAAAMGVSVPAPTVDFRAVHERMSGIVDRLRQGVEAELAKVNVIKGEASIASTGASVWVGGEQLFADTLIIATGSEPASLNIPGASLAITSDQLLALAELPTSIVIVGGGVIGMEFACILATMGVEVTVIEFCKEILPPFDRDIAKRLRTMLGRRGIKIVTGARVTAIAETAQGRSVSYESKGKECAVEAQTVLMAVGRKAVIPSGTEEAGIKVDRRGIMVDDDFKTSKDHIYAIGDCNGRMMLAHVASAQGRKVLGLDVNLDVVPADLFTRPEAAMAGLTEEQCKEREIFYKVCRANFASNGKAVTMGEADGLVKFVVDPVSGAILGCHILGPHAADLIQEAATAMASHLSIKALATAIHAHPTLTEAVQAAARQF